VVSIVRSGSTALESAMHVLFFVGFVPIIGTFALKWVIETKGRHCRSRNHRLIRSW
jgi:hypothetical protein